jgi:NADH-quinone oxidoreductase subunit G
MSLEQVMAVLHVDGRTHEVKEGQNLLQALLSLGYNLPYFCWHPALGSVGACRQCAVKLLKDEKDTQGEIVMACMTPASDGLRISISDPQAAQFRAAVLEWLMVSHPHDCPICDEGGECHLQDMTVMTGHNERRYRFTKTTFRNQDLGPLINHEMNRCIQCYRCVRFYHDYAGGKDLQPFASRNRTFFGRMEDGPLESPFSGNLVEICPTGVFTDKRHKQHHTRKWDLQTAPSVCVHCALGCNTIAGARYGQLRRILNRYNGAVNGYFLCDRGRFGAEFACGPQRISQPLLRVDGSGGETQVATPERALEFLGALLRDSQGVIGIGSPRASLEANYALRSLVGADRFYNGMSAAEGPLTATVLRILRSGPVRTPSLREVEAADAVLILGEDLTGTAPRLDLAVRQAARRRPRRKADTLKIPEWNDLFVRVVENGETGPVYIVTPAATALDEIADGVFRAAPEEVARFGFAVAHHLDPSSPPAAELPVELDQLALAVARDLSDAKYPLIISGTGCLSEAVLQAAANVAWALHRKNPRTELCLTLPECNSLGVGMLEEKHLGQALAAVTGGRADTVVILENDLARRAEQTAVDELRRRARHIAVIDCIASAAAEWADVVLPAAAFPETGGSLVNNEGRLQRYFQVYTPAAEVRPSWMWLRDAIARLNREAADLPATWERLEDVAAALATECAVFAPIRDAAPAASFRLAGMRVPRLPHRASGRTGELADRTVSEPKPPEDQDSPLAFSMEGYPHAPPPALIARYWAPGWNSVQALSRFQEEIAGPLRGGDAGCRLIEPAAGQRPGYYTEAPAPFAARQAELRIVPLHHAFGTEELSALAPGVAELAPVAYVALGTAAAAELGVTEEDVLEITAGRRAVVRILPELPAGVIGLPLGLAGLVGVGLRPWIKLPAASPTAARES